LAGPETYQKNILFTFFIRKPPGDTCSNGRYLLKSLLASIPWAGPASAGICRWLRLRLELYNQFKSRKKIKNVTIIVLLYHFMKTALKHGGFY